jgi:hypothetical protein
MALTPDEERDFREIGRLLDEAYEHYFRLSDGHCKSSDGYVALHFNNYFERQDDGGQLKVKTVEIYSYVLGPGRDHRFSSLAEALAAVREWHAEELAREYGDDYWGVKDPERTEKD